MAIDVVADALGEEVVQSVVGITDNVFSGKKVTNTDALL